MTGMKRTTLTRAMAIEIRDQAGITVVAPAGPRLDAEVAGQLRAALLDRITRGDRRIVLDLLAVDFIDSSGLGALVSALRQLKQLDRGGDLRLAAVQPPVAAVLEIIRLNRVFLQFPTVDDTVRSFGAVV